MYSRYSSVVAPLTLVQSAAGEATGRMSVALYSYWRSSCSWRVRLALNLKGIEYEYKAVNLLKDEQRSDAYLKLNPLGMLPTLYIDGAYLPESMSIIEYLEETRGDTAPLLPADALQRAVVRQIANIVVADIQPLQNLKILRAVGADKKGAWGHKYIEEGFTALETVLESSAGKYCVGDSITLADLVLVPQVYNARRFKVDMALFPNIARIDAELATHDAFKKAHPDAQPDAVAQPAPPPSADAEPQAKKQKQKQ